MPLRFSLIPFDFNYNIKLFNFDFIEIRISKILQILHPNVIGVDF